ncbi:oxygen-independent coproporphyrinogen III oxidase HemN [Thiobacillus denitrificans ATCC 25259]|uniref:Coproporphyrinogen-III oxidase n=1 Tax=Thiobacillus denitrificans (strain ATCC 25259 / T1) TaxID=292415 RepID=Q3SL31_THIDA|nr:oxygen-independent coproporphyrinogen III oxidase [Thiobacillus denitrificans]AAZ96588.1 oxygen-independent coproporphyrinogen III oxidase HemN [Thiobacillus denitrificans ATCC 25259]
MSSTPLELLQKYSVPGPRYTSYPTAPYFHTGFGETDWREALARARSDRALSLYAHVPFCDSLCYYCGCNMVATRDYSKTVPYLAAIEREMERTAALVDPGRVVRQLHWGGGTPTYLNPDDIRRLMAMMQRNFTIAPDAEISCEVDPRELTYEHLAALRETGFNRLSFGVQDMDSDVQQAVNRIQSEFLIRQVLDWARELGFSSINLDLIVGLPKQTVESFSRTLERVTNWAPDRLAVFAYAHVPWIKKHQNLINEADLPDAATRLGLQQAVNDALAAAGYVNIGLDHFARPEDELVRAQQNKTLWRNFQGYTTHKDCDILAFGVSSISQTDDVYMQNDKNLKRYQDRAAANGFAVERGLRLTRDDQVRRDAITRVMCDLELDFAAFGKEWDVSFGDYFADALVQLRPLADDGLVDIAADRISVTATGRLFLRNIGMCFDRYLKEAAGERPRYSRTA